MDYHATAGAGDRSGPMRLYLALLPLLLCACSTPLDEARTSFDEARYPDAVAQYRALAPEVAQLPAPDLFRYALYRGLSHLALGDAVPAEHWLTLAKRLADSSPTLANDDERGRLLSAWSSMGHMPGD